MRRQPRDDVSDQLTQQRGWYQTLLPMMAMMAGIRVSRTTKASTSTPMAKVNPMDLMIGPGPRMKDANTAVMIELRQSRPGRTGLRR